MLTEIPDSDPGAVTVPLIVPADGGDAYDVDAPTATHRRAPRRRRIALSFIKRLHF
jgi:hypothetical protein